MCDPFSLEKIFLCGSDANAWAIVDACNGSTNRCLFACGTYVSGDSGPFQNWSTSHFYLSGKIAGIALSGFSKEAEMQTVPFPYYIPCDNCTESEELTDIEKKCLKEINIRCLLARMEGIPYRALFLELLLAGNGAKLSKCFLIELGKLACHHEINLVVDEIMTGGRTGQMLLVKEQPDEFLHSVSHVTLGKWVGAGLVLLNKKYRVGRYADAIPRVRRGISTTLDVKAPLFAWKKDVEILDNAEFWWKQVLKALKCDEDQCWGAEALIFAPAFWYDMPAGLKVRPNAVRYTH